MRHVDRPGPTLDIELRENVREVALHGRLGDEQRAGNFFVRGAGGEQTHWITGSATSLTVTFLRPCQVSALMLHPP